MGPDKGSNRTARDNSPDLYGGAAGYGIYEASGLLVPMSFLKFSRNNEAEADYLGLQYIYKTGYDPTAFIDFFEKIETMEKRKPGTMSKLFATRLTLRKADQTDQRVRAAVGCGDEIR